MGVDIGEGRELESEFATTGGGGAEGDGVSVAYHGYVGLAAGISQQGRGEFSIGWSVDGVDGYNAVACHHAGLGSCLAGHGCCNHSRESVGKKCSSFC